MKNYPLLRFRCNPFPGYISSGKVVYGVEDKHPERIFSTFVAMFIQEGTLYFTEGDVAYTLKTGDWFIQTPGIRHYGHQAGGVKTVFHFVHFLPQGEWRIETIALNQEQVSSRIKQLDSGEGVRLPHFEIELPMRGVFPRSDWQGLFDKLQQEQAQGIGAIGKQAYFLELLERMVLLDDVSKSTIVPVNKVIAYIQQHYAEPLTVSELAHRFHFSPDYLTRLTKQTTGLTPSTLIVQYRMNKAKHLLVHTNSSIQQICYESGYHDIAVFSRMFKKHVGQSPSKYRQEQWGIGANKLTGTGEFNT